MSVCGSMRLALRDILFATDFTPISADALPYALEVAHRYHSRMHVVHVLLPAEWEPAPTALPLGYYYPATQRAQQQMAAFSSKRHGAMFRINRSWSKDPRCGERSAIQPKWTTSI